MASTGQGHDVQANQDFLYTQLREDILEYNAAVGSFNTHLNNHRERMNLQDIPYREPVTRVPETKGTCEELLDEMLDEVHLDSYVRRHENTAPIHEDAVEYLEIARDQLIGTLEDSHPLK